jgi:hypothetical protein
MQNHLSIQLCIASIFYLICDQINCHYRRRQHTISTVYTTPLLWTSCCNCRECSSLMINWWILLRAPASSTANCVIAVSFGTIFLGVPWATPLTALIRGVVQRVTLYPLGRQILETSFRSIKIAAACHSTKVSHTNGMEQQPAQFCFLVSPLCVRSSQK